MEENNIEQPTNSVGAADELASVMAPETDSGSGFGKFKDAQSLLNAYNCLEAEFTRKSQKLAEFQKKEQENAVFEKYDSLDEFLKSAPNNDKYKKEITEILNSNETLLNLPNKFEVALSIAKQLDAKTQELLTDQEFLKQNIYSNKQIKDNIIKGYLDELNSVSPMPKVISGNLNSLHFSPESNKPKTISEAGEIFSKMLK